MLISNLIREIKSKSQFHVVPWLFRKCKRPVKSVLTAKVYSVSKAVHDANPIAHEHGESMNLTLKDHSVVDTKDSVILLSKQRSIIDSSMKSNMVYFI